MPASVPVITLTPNPSLDETWLLESFHEDGINRVGGVRLDPGGKGINVSRLLRALGIDAPAAGFAGGETGRALRNRLAAEGVSDDMTEIAGETRRNLTLQIGRTGRTIKINHAGPAVLPAEFRMMADRLEKSLGPGSYLAVSGRFPPGMDQVETATLLSRLSAEGVRICTDCESLDLEKLTAIRPYLVKWNQRELDALLGQTIPLSRQSDCAYAASMLARRTGAIAVVTRGEDGAVAAAPEGEQIALAAPQVEVRSTVGAGDAMLGGMLAVYAGWRPDRASEQNGLLALALRTGVACGAAKAALTGTGMPARDAILDWYRKTSCPVTV